MSWTVMLLTVIMLKPETFCNNILLYNSLTVIHLIIIYNKPDLILFEKYWK